MAAIMAAKTLKYLYLISEVSNKDKWGVNFDIFDVKVLATRSDNTVRMLQSKMAVNMAAKTPKEINLGSEVIYKDKLKDNFDIFDVNVSKTRSVNIVRMLKSKIYGRQNTESFIFQLIGELHMYTDKWGVDFDIFNVMYLITRSDNSIRIL